MEQNADFMSIPGLSFNGIKVPLGARITLEKPAFEPVFGRALYLAKTVAFVFFWADR